MGVLDRILGQPIRYDGLAAEHATARGPVRLAATRIEPGLRPDRRTQARLSKRSAEQWNAYESIGEIGYVVDLFGNAMRRIRVFPAGVDDPEQGRVPLDECGWAGPQLVVDARDALERVRSVEHGQGEVLAGMATNLKVAGAGNLNAIRDDNTGLEDWRVLSTEALVYQRGQWVIKETPDDRRPTPVNLATDPVWRFWQRHPRWPGLAYSEMSRVLGHAENLQILERAARNRARSRAAGAGFLVMSNRYKLNARRHPNGAKGGDLFDDLMTAGTTAIEDEAAVSAFMPIMADFDVDDARKVMHHVTLDRPLSEVEEKREERLLRRIAQGLDAPPELITGMADLNHWTAWQVESSTYEAHIEPLALRIADILAVTVVRSALLVLGYTPELVARVTVGVDPSDLVRRPNRIQDAKDAHDALVISDASLRGELGYTDDDAPAPEELLRRMAIKRGITTEQLTAELLEKYADADVSRTLARGEAEIAEANAAGGGEAEPAGGVDEPAATSPEALVAAAVSQLGSRLQAIDDQLTARLTGAAEVAVGHVLQRAVSRAANRARGRGLSATVRLGARGLIHRLGADGMRALQLTEEDLVTDGDFTDLQEQWNTWVSDAYSSSTAAVEGSTGEDVDVDPEPDIEAGWFLLLGGLIASARAALTTDPTAPVEQLGETDPRAVVQPGHIRAAMARAGGAQGQTTDGGAVLLDAGTRPAGGVATGEHILAAAGRAGLQLVGHTWRVGTPPVPFPPHHALADVEFADLTDPKLANESGAWPGNARWHPQDHVGCRCSAEPIFEPISPN